jgi:hypothetical protein
MNCTECGRSILPVIAVDIDDTLSDYSGSLLRFANDYLDLQQSRTFYLNYDGSKRLAEYLGIDDATYRSMKVAYRQGGQKRLQAPMPGALALMTALYMLPAEIWLTTTRPYLRFDSTDPDTRFWLERYGIKYDHLLYEDDKYERLADIVGRDRVAIVLDNDADQCMRATELGMPALQVGSDFNRAPIATFSNRVEGLSHAGEKILDHLEQWKDSHG